MPHGFDQSILAIAEASPADFMQALAALPASEHDFHEDFKLALRDAVMQAFDDTTKNYTSDNLGDKHLPELFKCIDSLADELSGKP